MTKFLRFFPFLLALILVACGGSPAVKPSEPAKPGVETGASKKGGYYLDDGPGDNPPANIEAIPDAVPRIEPLNARANRPYMALGKSYTPMTEYRPYKQRGIASWYGRRYHGQKTSAGEVYDMYGMTGAHTTLPIPSYVRVTNPENQKSVVVRINDRGPFHSDRLIDLSYAASYKLGLVGKGSGLVEVESIDAKHYLATKAPLNKTNAVEQGDVEIKPLQTADSVEAKPSSEMSPPAKIEPVQSATALPGVFVQVGAFKSEPNAIGLSKKIVDQKLVENAPVNSWYNDGIYRVRIGPYANRSDAEVAAAKLKQALHVNTYIIAQP